MPTIHFAGRALPLESGETVLACLERHGVGTPSSCRSGVCQSCMMSATYGNLPPKSQAGLKEALKKQRRFLACVCVPSGDLTIDLSDTIPCYPGTIARVDEIAPNILRVQLKCPAAAQDASPGQFISIIRNTDQLTRPYSIAAINDQSHLELHVAVIPDGRISPWLRSAQGQEVQVQGPRGECYYQAETLDQPLLLAGTGTGLAPLMGVVHSAMRANHRGPITLYHGARTVPGLYLRFALRELESTRPNLKVVLSALEINTDAKDICDAPIDRLFIDQNPSLVGSKVYLCGQPQFVQTLKKSAFLAGANLQDIHSDPFITTAGA